MSQNTFPLVSVTILTYNHEKYIRECLDSVVCQQTDFPFEVIVADDASTDNAPQIIQEYADKYPNLIVPILRKKNIGICANSIDVVKRCRGKYIAALDGDDSWCNPKKLQIQFDFLEQHPDYSGIFSWANTIDNKGNTVYYKNNFGFHIFHRHTFSMLDFQLDNIPGQFSSGMYINIFAQADYNWEKLFESSSPVCDQIITMMLCMNHRKIYVTWKRLSNYRYILSNTVGTNYCSIMETKQDLNLYNFRYYNFLEKTMAELTGNFTSLRIRKYNFFHKYLKELKKKVSLSTLHNLLIMLQEEPHPFRMILEGVYAEFRYKNRYITPDTTNGSKKG